MGESSGEGQAGKLAFRLVVPGLHRYVRSARRFLASACRIAGVGDDVREPLGLALTEILNNAIDHGGTSPGAPLDLEFEITPDRVRLLVTESGEGGFDDAEVQRIARRARRSSLDDTQFRGRGLLLVCSLMDEMKVHNVVGKGTVIEVVKYR